MIVKTQRFGEIEVGDDDVIHFDTGIIGFTDVHGFVLLRSDQSEMIGWLQATENPALALPVVSAHGFASEYPDVPIVSATKAAGLGDDPNALAIIVVLTAPPGLPATVNLLAPIVVNAESRKGAQLMLEGTRFTTRELFIVPKQTEAAAAQETTEQPAAAR